MLGESEIEELKVTLRELIQRGPKASGVQRHAIVLDCRVGVSVYPEHSRSYADLARQAQVAMDALKPSSQMPPHPLLQ